MAETITATKTAEQTFTVIKSRRGRTYELTGTLVELIDGYSNTLANGHSYDERVQLQPATIKALVSNLNRAVRQLEKGSFNPSSYQLAKA